MNITRALATPGFMNDVELYYLASLASKHDTIVEIGSWRGRSAIAWAQNTKGKVYCIDHWRGDSYGFPSWWSANDPIDLYKDPDWLWNEFRKNTSDLDNILPLRVRSVDGAKILAAEGLKADVIFLDGDHSYEGMQSDIEAWAPLLQEGGVLCGHDYGHKEYHGVKKAVDTMLTKVRLIDSIWTTEERV